MAMENFCTSLSYGEQNVQNDAKVRVEEERAGWF